MNHLYWIINNLCKTCLSRLNKNALRIFDCKNQNCQILFDNQTYIGIANFGERPTLDGKKLLLEVHIFDFNEDIYGKHLTVEFLTFIREEKKFDSFSLLANQVEKDIQIVREYHLNK